MRFRFFCVFLGLAMGWTIAGAPAGASALAQEAARSPTRTAPTLHDPAASSRCKKVSGELPSVRSRLASRTTADLAKKTMADEREGYPAVRRMSIANDVRPNRRTKAKNKIREAGRPAPQVRPGPVLCLHSAESARQFPDPKSVGLQRADPDRMALIPTAADSGCHRQSDLAGAGRPLSRSSGESEPCAGDEPKRPAGLRGYAPHRRRASHSSRPRALHESRGVPSLLAWPRHGEPGE